MENSVMSVERILKYQFRDKKLLEEALTHSSVVNSVSYERLEFVGDAALSIAITNYIFLQYPHLDPGKLSLVRSANVSTEKLARAAIQSGLHGFIKHDSPIMGRQVEEFERVVSREDETVVHGGAVKAPKILADIIESVAAAVYVDSRMDWQAMWKVMRPLLEPIVEPEVLEEKPQPVTALYELCQKQGHNLSIRQKRKGKKSFANVYVNGQLVAKGSSKQKDNAKLQAAVAALERLLPAHASDNGASSGVASSSSTTRMAKRIHIDEAKQRLKELCDKNQWPQPIYKIVTEEGPPHDKHFSCSVKMTIEGTDITSVGETRPKVKEAENSAAAVMIFKLQ